MAEPFLSGTDLSGPEDIEQKKARVLTLAFFLFGKFRSENGDRTRRNKKEGSRNLP